MKVGIGYDIHRLVEDRKLFLGGVDIPYIKGLLGYSDGDVLLHAISDAILGAMGLGDIGHHFPNTDPQYKNISSLELLKKVAALMAARRVSIGNIDAVVMAEEPKIGPFRSRMADAISSALGIKKDKVNIKATTNEGVGSLGKGEAIAAYAVVALEEK
jgi:2-C-methyl-D-erythritol 2,4-cyclodiphosphate synthase